MAADSTLPTPVRAPRRDSLIPLALAAGCFGLALLQRPGLIVADTKIDLHVSPGSFIRDVLSAWTPTGSLGHVFAGQYGGYLWPMAPFFWLGDVTGVPTWVVGRLWLGLLLALSAWGMVRLLDALVGRPRGAAHVAGGVLFALNPYVVTYAGRTSIALLAYAALPWLLLCVHRGVRDPRGLWWPAAFALILTSTGGGVNVAVTAWLLLGPALLLAYELGWGAVAWRAARGFLVRLVPLAAIASLWWVAAVLVHGAFGLAFLRFTEQPGTIWGTTSLPESLRLMGFWTSYIGVGYDGTLRAFQSDAVAYLENPAVIAATFLVPALALGSFAWTRRQRYAPFLLALTLLGLLVMFVGFPEGTPLRKGATFTYNHVQAVQFLRTTYKAGPLVALGLAGLGALGFAAAWDRVRAAPRAVLAVAAAGLVALTVWPFARGVGVDRQLGFDRVPAAWKEAAAGLDRTLPAGDRAMVLPGQLFAYYDWGGTYDPVLPALTDKPVAVRFIVPFADLRSFDLQWTVDGLVSQERALPGQLRPLLDLLGVGAVITGSDDDRGRSGAVAAGDATRVLAGQGLGRPAASYGPASAAPPAAGTLGPVERVAQVRRYDTPTGGMVRVLPRGRETIVDGSAQAIADLAGFGALDPRRPLRYAADAGPAAIRRAAAAGAEVVVSDSNRRRVFVAARLRGNTGWTLQPSDPISEDGTQLDPFQGAGPDAQTVARLHGVKSVRAPFSPGFAQFPERRPFAAIDGDPRTAWLADRALAVDRHRLELRFDAPRDVDHVDLLPYADGRGTPDRIAVNGRTFTVHRGWNRLSLRLRHVDHLDVWIEHVRLPKEGQGGAGGIRELRVPGLRASEALRPPVVAETALRGRDLSRTPLTYLFDRTTGDDPARPRTVVGDRQRGLVRDQQDGETAWTREIDPPAARRWQADAWISVAPETADSTIDRWVGARGVVRFDGSARFEGTPRNRASSAFDGDPQRAWIAGWTRSHGAWLGWRSPRPRTLRVLRLQAPDVRVRFPTRVRLVADGRATAPLEVGPGGRVTLPRPLRARSVRLEVLAAAFPEGTPGAERRRRAVGIAEISGPGVPRAGVPRRGRLRIACAAGPALQAGGGTLRLRPRGAIEQLDAGRPLRAGACSAPVALPARTVTVHAPATPWRLDHVRLRSPALRAAPALGPAGGRVVTPGTGARGVRDGVRVAVDGPAWLVYGESYNRGWRASCDGRSLGAPVALQGYANAWPVERGCRDVSFSFAPNRALVATDVISLVACLVLLVLLVARRPRAAAADLGPLAAGPPPAAWPLRRALLAGVAAAAVLGFVFALRAGVVLGPLVALVLWRGVGARALALLGGGLLVVVVPVLYLALPEADTGYETNWAVDHIAAHWVAVLAVSALGAALWRTLAAGRRAVAPPPPEPESELVESAA
jgi:hypothetical protein